MKRWILLFVLSPIWAQGSSGTEKEGTGNFVFPWGESFENLQKQLRGGIESEQAGESLVWKKAGIERRYSFYSKKRIKEILTKEETVDGKRTAVFDQLMLEDEGAAKDARLYAVSVYLSGINFSGPGRDMILARLEAVYGKAGNLTGDSFDLENESTLVRVFLERRRGIVYLTRMDFSSREWAARIKNDREELNLQSVESIRRQIEEANRKLRVEPGTLMKPEGLRSQRLGALESGNGN